MASTLNIAEYIDRYPFHPDCHWDTEHLNFSTLSSPVYSIHFCAANNDHDRMHEEIDQPVNHWMIFLETGESTSLRISISSGEILPSRTPTPALICLASQQYRLSCFSPVVVSSAVPAGVTIERILRFLIAKGRDRYKFTARHVGCRYWCCMVASDLERKGWIRRGAANEVVQKASWYYPDRKEATDRTTPPPAVRSEIDVGEFF